MMNRQWKSYRTEEREIFRNKLLNFVSAYDHFIFYDSCNNHIYGKLSFHFLLAAGCKKYIRCTAGNAFETLRQFIDQNNDWCFGFLGYDLKNEIEKLSSAHIDGIGFDELIFFIPEVIVMCVDDEIRIGTLDLNNDVVFSSVNSLSSFENKSVAIYKDFRTRISKNDYIRKVELLKQHIIAGDIYEINFCQEFYAEDEEIKPVAVFDKLCNYSKAPFSCIVKWDDKYVISASPERFLKKEGRKIISQPMKGTIRRGRTVAEDEDLKHQLTNSEKDRAENIMIVDLVRNDLTPYARTGTIKVEELFGIYSFEHVHQMVSTISAEVREDVNNIDIIKNAFPMGSMTGAPKVMAMQLIEQYEETKRGLFSGAVGYFTPEKNFDFSVLIRSIMYNAAHKYVSIQTGGAIVYDSDPEQEYGECLLKAESLRKVLLAH